MARSLVLNVLLLCLLLSVAPDALAQHDVLPGTDPLTTEEDLSRTVVEGVDQYFGERIRSVSQRRDEHWQRNYSSVDRYLASIRSNRQRFREIIGAVDERVSFTELNLQATPSYSGLVAENENVRIYTVRWPVLEGVEAEGLLLEPKGEAVAEVVALPDAGWSPEQLAGLDNGLPAVSQFARRLAASGARVLVPTLIDRTSRFTGHSLVDDSDISHRTFIYLQAFHLGRHVIGYEVQKVLAAVDYFSQDTDEQLPIGVAGYGEGGLVGFYSAAVDERIDATLVSGYLDDRNDHWTEPLSRNVWGLVSAFGDAGVASLIAPRTLVVEASRFPRNVEGLKTPPLEVVRNEVDQTREYYSRLNQGDNIHLAVSEKGTGPPGQSDALGIFLKELSSAAVLTAEERENFRDRRPHFDPAERMKRQYDQLIAFNQHRMRMAPQERAQFWGRVDSLAPIRRNTFQRNRQWGMDQEYSVDRWRTLTAHYRDYFWKEILGWLPPASKAPNARTRMIYKTERWTGYEVVMDVWEGVINYGILLVPNDIESGEQRPVVVAQHGHAGRPQDVANPNDTTGAYQAFAAKLADRGFVVYAPQNLYTFDRVFRRMQRKAHSLGLTFWAPMIRQHEQLLQWLGSQSFVDKDRIGFYGLSYGGKSAMFLPAVLTDYAVSICSGDFNQRVWKHVDLLSGYTFPYRRNNSQLEFNIGNTYNYAEIAGLIAPRPFMVERGHYDNVAPDEWVAYEYARVRWLYAHLGIKDRTEITFFKGPHEINGEATFDFLREHLSWPAK